MIFGFIIITFIAGLVMFYVQLPLLGAIFLGLALISSLVAGLSYLNERQRIAAIRAHQPDWDEYTCATLIAKQINVGMTKEMVQAALGNPTNIDQRETTERSEKERWVYGVPRRDATYIWFNDDEVKKIKK